MGCGDAAVGPGGARHELIYLLDARRELKLVPVQHERRLPAWRRHDTAGGESNVRPKRVQWARIGLGAGEEQRSTSKCRIAQPSRESTEYTPLGSQTQLRLGGTSAPPEAPEQGKARVRSQRAVEWPGGRPHAGSPASPPPCSALSSTASTAWSRAARPRVISRGRGSTGRYPLETPGTRNP